MRDAIGVPPQKARDGSARHSFSVLGISSPASADLSYPPVNSAPEGWQTPDKYLTFDIIKFYMLLFSEVQYNSSRGLYLKLSRQSCDEGSTQTLTAAEQESHAFLNMFVECRLQG